MSAPMVDIAEVIIPKGWEIALRHERVEATDLPRLIGEGFTTLAGYVVEHGGKVVDHPSVVYDNLNPDGELDEKTITMAVVFPVDKPLPESGLVTCRRNPGGEAVRVTYIGRYDDGMIDVYGAMTRYIRDHGYTLAGTAAESYRTGPDVPPEQQTTVITIPFTRPE